MDWNEIHNDIEMEALKLLTTCADDYKSHIWEAIKDDVISDVIECSGIDDGEDFSQGDVALAIGRVLMKRLNIEY